MRDLTRDFLKQDPLLVNALAHQLLRIDANVRSHAGVALAGGALRDTYFGLKAPKDLDFAFYSMTSRELDEVVRLYVARCPGDVAVEDITADSEQYEGEVAANRILRVLHITETNGAISTEMDWILYDRDTLEGVTSEFDYNLNSFAMYYDEDFTLHIEWQGVAPWGVCTRNPSAVISPEREARFIELARQIDWEYVA